MNSLGNRMTRARMRAQRLDPRRLDIVGEVAEAARDAVHSWPAGYQPIETEQPLVAAVERWDAIVANLYPTKPDAPPPLGGGMAGEIVTFVASHPWSTSSAIGRAVGGSAAQYVVTLCRKGKLVRRRGKDGLFIYAIPATDTRSQP